MMTDLEERIPQEIWKEVPNYTGLYRVSSLGRVISTTKGRFINTILIGDIDRKGYQRVLLSKNGIKKRHKVHRLVCAAFKGPPPPQTECGHRNGLRNDNRISNLDWISRSENTIDAIKHGTWKCPVKSRETHHAAKLTTEQVVNLRKDRKDGMSFRLLGKKYKISFSHARRVAQCVKWKEI